ncbi:hypothetical protein MHYP_G00195060 [Metynnis hypsauchen]
MSKRGKKRNFTECEVETLLNEVEVRKKCLFGALSSGPLSSGPLSSGITAKRKRSEWDSVCEAVNAVGSEQRTLAEIKKKWSDIKVDVKRRLTAHRQSVTQTGGGGQEISNSLHLTRELPVLWVTRPSPAWWIPMWGIRIVHKGLKLERTRSLSLLPQTWDAPPASLVHLASRRPPALPTCQQLMSVQPAVS